MLARSSHRFRQSTLSLLDSAIIPSLYCTQTILRANYSSHPPSKRDKGASYIPFEGLPASSGYNFANGDTTITPSEHNAFKKLFDIAPKHKPSNKPRETTHRPNQDVHTASAESPKDAGEVPLDKLEELIISAMNKVKGSTRENSREFPFALRNMAEEAEERRARRQYEEMIQTGKQARRDARDEALNRAVDSDVRALQERLDKTETDEDVWDVLQDVLARVRTLGLDTEHGSIEQAKSQEKTKSSPPVSRWQKSVTGPATDLQILTITLPDIMVRIQRTLDEHYPTSSLGLAILPSLRRSGPASVATGASTALYEAHLRRLYKAHPTALTAIISVLDEMEREAYPFSVGIHELLQEIVFKADEARNKKAGPTHRLVWSSAHLAREIEELKNWLGLVGTKREEEAIRLAREAEAAGGDGSGA